MLLFEIATFLSKNSSSFMQTFTQQNLFDKKTTFGCISRKKAQPARKRS